MLLDIAFARSQGIRGLSLLSLTQWRAYAAAWLTPITLAAAGYALGALLAFGRSPVGGSAAGPRPWST